MTGSIAASFPPADRVRRELLTALAAGVGLTALLGPGARAAPAAASELPLLKESDSAARAKRYVSDANRAQGGEPGANCSNCSLYGSLTASEGTCSLFPSNLVAVGGWCSAWSSL